MDEYCTEPDSWRLTRLELDNAYLLQQNDHLTKELAYVRHTINALKMIVTQKDMALLDTRQELDRACVHIRALMRRCTPMSGRPDESSGALTDDSSSDDQDDHEEVRIPMPFNIVDKLPLRAASVYSPSCGAE